VNELSKELPVKEKDFAVAYKAAEKVVDVDVVSQKLAFIQFSFD
jgi:hypothetical protein